MPHTVHAFSYMIHDTCCAFCVDSSEDGSFTLPHAMLLPPSLQQLHDDYEVIGELQVGKVGNSLPVLLCLWINVCVCVCVLLSTA